MPAQHAGVVAIERLEQQHLVAGAENGGGRGLEGSGGAVRDEDFALRIDLDAVATGQLSSYGAAQARQTVEPRVDVKAVADRPLRALGHDGGRIRVADALRQVDATYVVASDSHGADLGLDDAGSEFGQVESLGCCHTFSCRCVNTASVMAGITSRRLIRGEGADVAFDDQVGLMGEEFQGIATLGGRLREEFFVLIVDLPHVGDVGGVETGADGRF